MSELEYKRLIIKSIAELKHLFHLNPDIFLTEDDVRCVLYQLLTKNIGLTKKNDGNLTSSVHSEVRWYGKEKDMRNRTDLVVLDTHDLRVNADGFPLPSKGYGFNNFYAAIEIKLRRKGKVSNKNWLKMLEKDASTLLSLRRKIVNAYEPLLILIAFDRKSNINELIAQANLGVDVVYECI